MIVGGRQADATVMAATAAAASARPAVRSSNNLILRRSGSLMDFSGEAFFFPTNKTTNSFTVLSLSAMSVCVYILALDASQWFWLFDGQRDSIC